MDIPTQSETKLDDVIVKKDIQCKERKKNTSKD